MNTIELKNLHSRSIRELKLIEVCKGQKGYFKGMLESKKDNPSNYWQWTEKELIKNINKYESIEKRLYIWYIQTLNKIMRYSN